MYRPVSQIVDDGVAAAFAVDAHVEPPVALLVGDGAELDCGELPLRIAGRVALASVGERLAQQGRLDLIWVRLDAPLDQNAAAVVRTGVAALGAALVVEAQGEALDSAFAAFADDAAVQFLSSPTPVERAMAIAIAGAARRPHVADRARDDAQERIDRLQDEVARISALLGALADRPYGHFQFAEGFPPNRSASGPVSFSPVMRDTTRHYRTEADLTPYARSQPDEGPSAPVRRLLRHRRMREQFFPTDLFADPAWDMLLDLYAARLEGRSVAVSSLCIAAAVPATTALRWIKTMTDTGLFERHADPRDGRRIFIGLSDKAAQAMERYFTALEGVR